jgi:hypothetical protein
MKEEKNFEARNLEQQLEGLRIRYDNSLLKLVDILAIYSQPSTVENLSVYFETVPDHADPEDSIAFTIAVSNKIGDPLIWREEYEKLMTWERE